MLYYLHFSFLIFVNYSLDNQEIDFIGGQKHRGIVYPNHLQKFHLKVPNSQSKNHHFQGSQENLKRDLVATPLKLFLVYPFTRLANHFFAFVIYHLMS